MLYRMLTEDINRDDILELTSNEFDGFTIYKATGYWQGVGENSLIIEVISENDIADKWQALAETIKANNKQQAVLIETMQNHSYMV